MKLLLQSSRRFFRRHPGQLVLSLIGIAAGVAVVTGVALIHGVLVDSLDSASDALTPDQRLRIESRHGRLDEAVYADLATSRGAPQLIPVLSARVRVNGQPLELIGIDPFSLTSADTIGVAAAGPLLQSAQQVLVTDTTLGRLGLSPDEPLRVQINGQWHELEIGATLGARPGLDERLIMDIAAVQHLLKRSGELSWIDAPVDAEKWLRARLSDEFTIRSSRQRQQSAARLTEGMRANLAAMSLLSLAVGLFVVFSVLSFLAVQRRASFGMLRALGVTPVQISALLMIETAILTGLGALLGLTLGTVLADQLMALIRQPVVELYGLLPPARVRPTLVLYASLWALTMALGQAAVIPVWREARQIAPGVQIRALPAEGRAPWVSLTGLGMLLGGVLIVVWSTRLGGAFAGLFLALAGAAVFAPDLALMVLRAPAGGARHRLAGRALAMLLSARRRLAPALAALSLALALAAGIGMMVLGFRGAVDDWIDRLLRADHYVTLAGGQINDQLAGRVAAMDGVEQISSARRVKLGEGRDLIAYDLPSAAWQGFEWLDGDPEAARDAFMKGHAVIVSEPFERRTGLGLGDAVSLPAPDGTLALPIAAIYRDYGSDRGTVAIHAPLYRRLWQDRHRDSLGLYLGGGAPDAATLVDRLRDIDPRLTLTSRETIRARTLAVFDRTFRISWALAVLVGLIAVIALVSALLAVSLERRREYATLRAIGLTPAAVAGTVISQTIGLAIAAAIVAVPLALAIHSGLSLVVQPRAFGWSLPLSWPLWPLAIILALAAAAGLAAGIYPAWRIGRRDPAGELRGS